MLPYIILSWATTAVLILLLIIIPIDGMLGLDLFDDYLESNDEKVRNSMKTAGSSLIVLWIGVGIVSGL